MMRLKSLANELPLLHTAVVAGDGLGPAVRFAWPGQRGMSKLLRRAARPRSRLGRAARGAAVGRKKLAVFRMPQKPRSRASAARSRSSRSSWARSRAAVRRASPVWTACSACSASLARASTARTRAASLREDALACLRSCWNAASGPTPGWPRGRPWPARSRTPPALQSSATRDQSAGRARHGRSQPRLGFRGAPSGQSVTRCN
jgi:hypothetical protein